MANRRFIDFPIASSVGDSDIILIWQSGANKQTTKATFLSGLPENLDELNDVAISGLTNGQILRYDSVTGKWENTDQGNLDLNDLNDVSIVSPSNGQVLVYNSSTSKWENSSGGYVPYTGAVTTVNLGAQTIQAGSFVKAGGTAAQFLKANGSVDSNVYGTGTVTSVALTMPTAFSVANSPITTAGTLAVTGAGNVGQYIRGDGSLADFPESSGGGSSVSYYLNGSVAQGTIGGVAYKELNKVPILGAGTDFTINADGYIASFITDAGDPNLLEIPGGNWNFETYFSASSSGGTPTFYVELYKVNSGGTATLIASNSGFPELIAFGTNIISYFSTLAVPTTTLALTDRLAVRYYVTHSGRTITLHTEDNHLCQIVTTFTTGITALNGLTAQVQNFAVGTSGTDFNIASATATHTFNLPTASATNRGALSSADWTTFNNKQNALTNPVTGTGTTNYLAKFTGASTIGNSQVFDNGTLVGIGTASPTGRLQVKDNGYRQGIVLERLGSTASRGFLYIGDATNSTTLDDIYFDANNTDLHFRTGSGGTDDRLTITVGGNLLVGNTTDNGGKLQITGGATRGLRIDVNSGVQAISISPNGIFGIDEPALGNGRFIVNTNGKVGIGTNVPSERLHIAGVGSALAFDTTGAVANNLISTVEDFKLSLKCLRGTSSEIKIGNNNLEFLTNAISRITVFSDGNTFIGTSPTNNGARLQVNGAATFTNSVSTSNEYYVSGTGQNAFKINSSGSYYGMIQNTAADKWSLAYGVNGAGNTALGTSVLTWTGSGNVGIGTASPSEKLEVQDGYLSTYHNVNVNDAGYGIQFYTNGGGSKNSLALIGLSQVGTARSGNLIFSTSNSGAPTTKMIITSSGNVQVRTAGQLQVFRSDNARSGLFYCNNLAAIVEASTDPLRMSTPDRLEFYAGSTERMRITSSGNVGIGTASPLQTAGGRTVLTIDGGSSTILNFGISGTLSGYIYSATSVFGFYSQGDLYLDAAGAKNIISLTNGVERTRITSGGNVLIGTTTDSGHKLRVNGTALISSSYTNFQTSSKTASSGGTITFNYNTDYNTGSDGDNTGGIIIINVNEASTNVANGNAVYIGTVINPRGGVAIVTQISRTLGSGITALTVSSSGNNITVTSSVGSGGNFRATLTFIGGAGTS